jgi:uncharacterized protein YlxW (UPF0749 family)
VVEAGPAGGLPAPAPASWSEGPSSLAGRAGGPTRRWQLAGRVVVALSVGIIGFLATAQIRGTRGVIEQLEAESEEDLTRIFSSLNDESAALLTEISELRLEIAALESSAARDRTAREAASRELEELQILAGLVAARGPGVAVRINDPGGAVAFELMLDVVQELRDAGAEAIAVNGRRVGAATAFSRRKESLTVGGKDVSAPYEIVAIGDAATLEAGLKIPGGALDTLGALEGLEVTVDRRGEVRAPALDPPPSFKVAHPIQ